MKLKELKLKNFRGYKEKICVEFENLTAFVGKNDVGKSTILEALEIFFNNKIMYSISSMDDLLPFEVDLTSDDGMRDYGKCEDKIGLLTADLYRKNRHLLKPIDEWWWLATPKTCTSDFKHRTLVVDEDGMLNDDDAWEDTYKVRPFICLRPDVLVGVPNSENSSKIYDITEFIKKWAADRNLNLADPKSQMVKLLEEAGELATGVNKNKQDLIVDSIGDVYVVLVIFCMQLGLDINDCIKVAYNEIKDRKGKVVNGTFVKEEDLEV